MHENQTVEEKSTEKKKVERAPDLRVKANKKGKHVMVFLNFLRICFLPFYCFLKPFKKYGYKKIADGACVYIGNHYTMFDPAYMIASTWEGIHFFAKKENFKTPVISFFVRHAKAISVNRDGTDVRALLEGLKCLKNGEKVGLFPEGTRNKSEEELLPFHSGAATLAIRAKVPIIPVLLYSKPKLFRVTHVIYGEPIELSKYYDKKLTESDYDEADAFLRDTLMKMRKEHTEYLQSKKAKK